MYGEIAATGLAVAPAGHGGHRVLLCDAARFPDQRPPPAAAELEEERAGAGPPDEILRLRRDLQFELHGNQYAAEDAAHDAPGWTAHMWPRHLEIQAEGYAALSHRRPGPGR